MCLRIASIAAVALYLVPTGAHLFELPGKMALPPAEYMIVQRIYSGWALFGGVIFAALLLTLVHAVWHRRDRATLGLSLMAFGCLLATQVVFWWFTYPMNVASSNWTRMPDQFERVRWQWEYSHAAGAVLTFLALLVIAAAVARSRPGGRGQAGL